MSTDRDEQIRMAAFDHVRALNRTNAHLTRKMLAAGFVFEKERIPLVNPRRGIFKPRQMRYLLSITTVFPRPGRRVWYDDQRQIHQKIFEGEEVVEYAFMGQNPETADNRRLREACDNHTPVIYFLGISPGCYQAVIPTYISDWDGFALKATLAFQSPDQHEFEAPKNGAERRYALRVVKERLHQATFRQAVLLAYSGCCAISGLPETQLLDAAHITADKDVRYGQPVVTNGLSLSKIHHAAFDAHLIGIDPDYRLHVSERLLDQKDGLMLQALKQLNGKTLRLPNRNKDYPDRERLDLRFEQYRKLS